VHNFELKEYVLYCMLPMSYKHICSYVYNFQVVKVLSFVYKMVKQNSLDMLLVAVIGETVLSQMLGLSDLHYCLMVDWCHPSFLS
jgi:hypothetical protein